MPYLTIILLLANVLVFIFSLIFPELYSLAFVPSKAFLQPWTFITSIFLHAGFEHLFFNMFALFIFGLYLESRIGSERFLLIYFLSGIAGNFGYMLTTMLNLPYLSPDTPGVGASGAIYGVLGTLAILSPFAIVYLGYLPMPMIFAAFIWGITEILGIFIPSQIARGAHLAGLATGILYGYYLRKK